MFGKILSDQKFIQEGIKSRLNSGNAYYHSGQNLLSSTLLSKHLEIGHTELKFCLLFCMCVILRRPRCRRNVDFGCLRTGCRRQYFGL